MSASRAFSSEPQCLVVDAIPTAFLRISVQEQEFILLQSTSYSMLYSGYFLDHVVTPIYEVFATPLSSSFELVNIMRALSPSI